MNYKKTSITIENTPYSKELCEAAPDMYEALKAIVNWYEVKGEMLCTNDQPYELLKQALRKAEGGTD